MARWLLVVGTLLMLGVVGLTGLYAAIRADLPPRVASHWGGAGVDSTQTASGFVATAVGLIVGLVALQALVAAFLPVEGRRALGVVSAGLIGFIGLGLGGSLWDQRGLTDPYAAPSPGGWLALGFALAVPLAGVTWWLLPTQVPEAAHSADGGAIPRGAPRLDRARAKEVAATLDLGRSTVRPGEHGTASARARSGADPAAGPGPGPAWRDPIPVGRGNLAILALLVLFGAGMALTPARWIAVPIVLAIGVVIALMARSELVVDSGGVRVQAYGRVTWMRARMSTIRFADVEDVRPLRDFGGYGLRFGFKGRGFVTVPGPALHLAIPAGADTWISCAHPELAAGVINEVLAGRAT